MTIVQMKAARKLAQEFINTVDELITVEDSPLRTITFSDRDTIRSYQPESPKHRGAVRRKSMDLTRALAEMRRR